VANYFNAPVALWYKPGKATAFATRRNDLQLLLLGDNGSVLVDTSQYRHHSTWGKEAGAGSNTEDWIYLNRPYIKDVSEDTFN
jgi:hypothetical protein